MTNVITVRGNKGKSVFSFFLADYFSKHGKRTILISTDGKKPMYTLLFPTLKESDGHSLGKILSVPDATEINIFNNAHVISKEMLVLSYCSSDSDNSYPDISHTPLSNLYSALKNMCDLIVVDISSGDNTIDQYFLKHSKKDICITTANSIGYSYRTYHSTQNSRHILFNNSKYNPIADVLSTFDSTPLNMPYFPVFECVYNGYDITDISLPIKYKKLIQTIAGEMDGKNV